MSRRSFINWVILVLVAVGALSACAVAPTHPSAIPVPTVRASQVFSVNSDTTAYLDCVSSDLRRGGADAKKVPIFLAPMPNTAGPKVGKVDIPQSITPFARAAFDRLSSGFRVLSDEDHVAMRLSGGLYAGTPFRVLDSEVELLGLGLGSRVEAVDISLQLYLEVRVATERAKIFEQSGTGVTMNVRMYSAEQGGSAFVVTSGKNGLATVRFRAGQEAGPNMAIQSAVNTGVATLVRARAAREWDVSSTCNLGAEGKAAIGADTYPAPNPPVLDVRLVTVNDQVCAVVRPRRNDLMSGSTRELLLDVEEFRGEGIEIRRRTIQVASLKSIVDSRRSVCLPRGAFDERTEQIRYRFHSGQGRHLGSADLFFQ